MLFSSMTFIYIFLPIVLLLYLVSRKELHNPILLLASIMFYAWGEPKYLAIMLLTIVINYFGAIFIEKTVKYKKLFVVLTVIADLSFLIYFKYFNFIIENINGLFHSNIHALNIILPLGISFYTFQALSYVIDVYRGEVKAQKDIYKLALFIVLFPQLIAGPIVKYHDVEEQIDSREVNFDKVCLGVKRFIIGLSKKMLIANTVGLVVDKIFIQDPHTFSHLTAWIGAFAYTLQLYFDFSGYSDMAIGLGLIFGFRFMENFNYPYISKSITEFWTRWHISLSTWFKQYLYFSLGGSRVGKIRTYINLGIVFLLTGVWHGAQWTFVLWGVVQSFFILLEKALNIKEYDKKPHPWYINALRHVYCMSVFVIGLIIFRSDSVHYAWNYMLNMVGILQLNPDKFAYNMSYYVDNITLIAFAAGVLCGLPLFKNMLEVKSKIARLGINIWLLILFFLSTIMIASSTYNPFIYFRF